MKWFGDGVAAAIAACRQDGALFIVYVSDDSASSRTTDDSWSSEEVSQLLSSKKYVALKVLKDSVEYRQFSQLYAVLLIPSIFCIGRRGQSLLTMNGAQTVTQLKEKLNNAFSKFDAEFQPTPPSLSEQPVTASPAATSVTATQPTSLATPTESKPTNSSKEETLKRYQEKIRERREKRERDDIKDDGRHEVQRREHAKNIAKLKQEREEQQTQNWLKKRQEEKEQAKQAREAIKLKLEQDKLERQARRKDAGHLQKAHAVPHPSSSSSAASTSSPSSNMCRIQLKLPAGNATVLEMNKTDTLAMLRQHVAKEINDDIENVLLCRSYPRQELDHDVDSHTMLQLQLAPSGVVIVRVKKSMYAISSKSESGSGLVGILMGIVHFLIFCFNAIKNFIVGLFSGGSSPDPTSDQLQTPHQHPMQSVYKSDRNEQGDTGLRVRKFRQEDYHDDSEEDATYNGNSTQQQ